MKEADHESVDLCLHRFASFLQARDELDRTLAAELIDAVMHDDGAARDRALALAEACARAIREKSGWRVEEGELLPAFDRLVRELTVQMRSVLEDFARRREESEPRRDGRMEGL